MEPTNEQDPFAPGQTIVFREVWREAPWSTYAVTVVSDEPGRTILYRPIGAPGMMPVNEHGAFGRSRMGHWFEPRTWTGRHALMIHDHGDPFSIWCMWDDQWRHASWYVNLEQPWRRAAGAIETMDHELDIVVGLDGSWEWKDEDKLAEHVAGGAHTLDEAADFRAHGERVLAERVGPWTAPFDEGWEAWRPDPAWSLPVLPADWDVRR